MRLGDHSLPRFVVAGALNSALTYLLYLLLLRLLSYLPAYSISYVTGIVLGYLLNAFWVFRGRPSLGSALAYPLLYMANYVLGASLLWLFVEWMKVPQQIAPLLVLCVSVPVMYLSTAAIFRRMGWKST